MLRIVLFLFLGFAVLSSNSLAYTTTYSTTGASGSFVVPANVTRIQIIARGADGGLATATTLGGGAGASITSVFNVTPGTVISYVVGQTGSTGDFEAGGGGGTGVFIGSTLVMVAGGGGGEDNTGAGHGGRGTTAGSNGGTAANGGLGGTAGTGGGAGGGTAGDGGGGGGGITSAGGTANTSGGSLTTGGAVADTNVLDGLSVSPGGTSNQTTDPAGADGRGASGGSGFGGGGAGSHREAGGGGGYSGGGGGGSGGFPGGGGSYNNTAYSVAGVDSYVSGAITAGGGGLGTGQNGFVTIAYTTIQLRKITTGNIGTFSFSSANLAVTPVSITTTTTGTAYTSAVVPIVNFSTSTQITEAVVTGFNLTAISCTGLGGGTATNSIVNRRVTLNAAAVAPGNDVVCTFTNNHPAPALILTKVATDTTDVTAGQAVGYTYTVTNPSTVAISNVSVADMHNGTGPAPIPGSEVLITDVAPTGNSTDATLNNGVWSVLGPGDSIRFSANYVVLQADIDLLQ